MEDRKEVVCRHCGAKNKAEAIECEACGNYLDEELDPGEAGDTEGQSQSNYFVEHGSIKQPSDREMMTRTQGHSKYPALNTISSTYRVFAILVIIGGAIIAVAALSKMNASPTLAFTTFATTAIVVAVSALTLFAVAEGINLLIDIESHLRNLPERLKSKQ